MDGILNRTTKLNLMECHLVHILFERLSGMRAFGRPHCKGRVLRNHLFIFGFEPTGC